LASINAMAGSEGISVLIYRRFVHMGRPTFPLVHAVRSVKQIVAEGATLPSR
jgi:hypothetical protein